MKKQLLNLIALLLITLSYSQTFTDNFIDYNVTSPTTVEITGYDISGGTIVSIPATVIDTGITYDVTSIANLAFVGKGLTNVTIPNSVLNMGLAAFQNNALTTVIIPDNITSISNNLFALNQLTSVTIPNGVTSIGNNAFLNNNQLSSVSIPEGVTTIGEGTFLNNQLSTVTLPSTLVSIGIGAFVNNPLIDVTSLASTPPSMTNSGQGTFSIPSNIDLFVSGGASSAYAASTWNAFNTITEAIGVGGNYTSNFITYEVTSINPDTAMIVDYDMSGGASVDIPTSIVNGIYTYDILEIDTQAFDNKGLTSVTFSAPSNIVAINGFSFRNNQLTSIVFPDSVVTIGDSAFELNLLTSITFTDNIIALGVNAFAFNQLTVVDIPAGISALNLGVFQQNQITSITIPNNITAIEAGAFENNLLPTITLPNTITSIAARAFKDNPLTSVYSESIIPPAIVTQNSIFDSFAADRSSIHLHIPAGTLGTYVTDPGALWTGFNPVTEDALSIDDFELANDVLVISSTDALKIISSNAVNLKSYTLYSILGSKVATGSESNIITSSFTKGVYILKLDFDRGNITKKILIN